MTVPTNSGGELWAPLGRALEAPLGRALGPLNKVSDCPSKLKYKQAEK